MMDGAKDGLRLPASKKRLQMPERFVCRQKKTRFPKNCRHVCHIILGLNKLATHCLLSLPNPPKAPQIPLLSSKIWYLYAQTCSCLKVAKILLPTSVLDQYMFVFDSCLYMNQVSHIDKKRKKQIGQ